MTAHANPVSGPVAGLATTAWVIGASGGIGAALVPALGASHAQVLASSRSSAPALNWLDEASIAASCEWAFAHQVGTVVVATGVLHSALGQPEKSASQLNAAYLQEQFTINTIGPMLLMKHLLPKAPKSGDFRLAFLSAKVGSIGDNQLGGWYGYRAAKAALNQAVRTASIELKRRNPASICVALHPGTVATALSEPFQKEGLNLQTPEQAASRLAQVLMGLQAADSGSFFAYDGQRLPW